MKKVIAFVSVFSALATNNYEYYDNEEKKTVSGMLTNEAPIKCLLEKYPDIDEIICLISKGAQDPPKWDAEKSPGNFRVKTEEEMKEKTGGLSPYQYLEKKIREFLKEKEVVFTPIDYDEKGDNYFAKKIIPKILENVHGDDIIFLETTGGFRINITQMMLLTHILNYQGTELACAVYSDFNKKRIFDVTDSYRDFDLVNGLNEFVNTGATGMLESYFTSETAKELVFSMKRLNEGIILARIPTIQKRKEKVEFLLGKAEKELAENKESGNSILTVLLPIFRSKYSQISTIPELIKWCAANNLIQQAFTLYVDWIPQFIMKEAQLITKKGALNNREINEIRNNKRNPFAYLFRGYFITQSCHDQSIVDAYVSVLNNIKKIYFNKKASYKYKRGIRLDEIKKMLQDYAYAKTIRDEMNHALSDANFIKSDSIDEQRNQERKEYLIQEGYIFDEDRLDIETLRSFLNNAMDHLLTLANR